jgi:FkbM family methyltransferase
MKLIFLRNFRKNIINHPKLTILTSLFIILNFILEKTKLTKYLISFGNRIIKINIDNTIIKCRITDLVIINEIFLAGEYDYITLTEDSILFDIGANIGLYSLKSSKKCKKIIAIEASKGNFTLLKNNLYTNKINNVIPINTTLSDYNGKMKFFIEKYNNGACSIHKHKKNMEEIEVNCKKLDDVITDTGVDINNKKIFIKMDVEGAELKILKGATKLLNKTNITIIMEAHPNLINTNDTINFLNELNFKTEIIQQGQPFIIAKK